MTLHRTGFNMSLKNILSFVCTSSKSQVLYFEDDYVMEFELAMYIHVDE
jgi:hypothetical protein